MIKEVGEQSKAICHKCENIVSGTYAVRDMKFSDRPGIVKDILVLVCDECDSIIATPPQSTPAIKAALESQK